MSNPTDNFPAKLIYQPVVGFAEQIASKAPAPGGGSAAALSGMVGAGLLSMVAVLTSSKKKYEDRAERFTKLRENTEDLRVKLAKQIDEDTLAFKKFQVANRLPDTDPELTRKKEHAVAAATIETIKVPELTMILCLDALEYATEIVRDGNENTISDVATGAEMLLAGLEGAANNVLINILGRSDSEAQAYRKNVIEARAKGRAILNEVRTIVDGKLNA
ncbi:cyclodeaminase/cyclohydrolase family protein [bacterium]|nr:cyclodeaminase/cyclohydrolase family protein [bacterium]MBU1638713.1 cyclodeaminase/cyclohydrolase family protein [bacterium]